MQHRTRWIVGGVAAAALIAAGTGVAFAATDDAADTPLTGSTLEQASAAALAHTGGVRVSDSEVSEEGGQAYEVEVVLEDGTEVEVHLDKDFTVVSEEAEGASDSGEQGQDD